MIDGGLAAALTTPISLLTGSSCSARSDCAQADYFEKHATQLQADTESTIKKQLNMNPGEAVKKGVSWWAGSKADEYVEKAREVDAEKNAVPQYPEYPDDKSMEILPCTYERHLMKKC